MEEMFGLIGDIGRHHNAINLLNGDLKKRLEKAVNHDDDDIVNYPDYNDEGCKDDDSMDQKRK